MFGFVVPDIPSLSKEDSKIYNSYYCGLCRTLGQNFGFFGKMTLSYDMTFLYLFLSAYFNEKEEARFIRCGLHPLKKKCVYMNRYAYYSACMTVLLSYYKLQDDVKDDNSVLSKIGAGALREQVRKAEEAFPHKASLIKECLRELDEIEKDDVHNADIPADSFGRLMGGIFDIKSENGELYSFGAALGKAIYLMDAVIDFKKDLKKMKYNPLVETDSKNFQQILTILLGDTTQVYDKMNITINRPIIDNILYSGIWSKFRRKDS